MDISVHLSTHNVKNGKSKSPAFFTEWNLHTLSEHDSFKFKKAVIWIACCQPLCFFPSYSRCKSGVKIPGTTVSDVVCNQDLLTDIIRPTPTGKKVSLLSLMTSRQPDEGAQTQGIHTTTTTTSSPRAAITHKTKVPVSPLNTGSHIGKTFAATDYDIFSYHKGISNNL